MESAVIACGFRKRSSKSSDESKASAKGIRKKMEANFRVFQSKQAGEARLNNRGSSSV